MEFTSSAQRKNFGCRLSCLKNQGICMKVLQKNVTGPDRGQSPDFWGLTFLLFFTLQFVSTVSVATLMPLVDAISLDMVAKDQTKYGYQRVC
jgi:hypothetical protein